MSFKVFSKEQARKDALTRKIKRAQKMAKGQINPDFDKDHVNEVKEFARTGTFKDLKLRLSEDDKKFHEKRERKELIRYARR